MNKRTYISGNIYLKIAIVVGIMFFCFLVGYLVYNVESLKQDPLAFGAIGYGIDYCSCFSDNGIVEFNKTNVWITKIVGDEWGLPKS